MSKIEKDNSYGIIPDSYGIRPDLDVPDEGSMNLRDLLEAQRAKGMTGKSFKGWLKDSHKKNSSL